MIIEIREGGVLATITYSKFDSLEDAEAHIEDAAIDIGEDCTLSIWVDGKCTQVYDCSFELEVVKRETPSSRRWKV